VRVEAAIPRRRQHASIASQPQVIHAVQSLATAAQTTGGHSAHALAAWMRRQETCLGVLRSLQSPAALRSEGERVDLTR
jgi:hypothetical protein